MLALGLPCVGLSRRDLNVVYAVRPFAHGHFAARVFGVTGLCVCAAAAVGPARPAAPRAPVERPLTADALGDRGAVEAVVEAMKAQPSNYQLATLGCRVLENLVASGTYGACLSVTARAHECEMP